MATSYNSWAASRDAAAIGINTRWEPIPGHKFPGGIKSGPVEDVFTYLVINLDERVERIELYASGDEWGYNYKQSANSPSLLSCHASGTAIDYNATRHPNGVRNTWSSAQIAEIREIQNELSGVIHWLGDAARVPDEQHFEIRGTAAEVQAAADRIRTPKEPFTVGQYEELTRKIDNITSALLIDISEQREFDDDVPENLAAQQVEIRKNVRTIIEELNRLRAKESLPPLPIVT